MSTIGRPKNNLRSTFQEHPKEAGVSWHGAHRIASAETDGDFSSPSAPRVTCGTKPMSRASTCNDKA